MCTPHLPLLSLVKMKASSVTISASVEAGNDVHGNAEHHQVQSSAPSRMPGTIFVRFYVDGMSCDSCAAYITEHLQKLPGVVQATVSFASKQADIVLRVGDAGTIVDVVACVEKLGYKVLDELPASATANSGGGAHPMTTASSVTAHLPSSKLLREGSRVVLNGGEDCELSEVREFDASFARPVTYAETRVLIEGMSCGSCAARIEKALLRVDGVKEASVNFATMTGKVVHDTAVAPVDAVLLAIAEMGYTPAIQHTTAKGWQKAEAVVRFHSADGGSANAGAMTTTTSKRRGDGYEHHLLIEGMSCASCAAKVERAMQQFQDVQECVVSFATGTAFLVTSQEDVSIDLIKHIQSMGYSVTVTEDLGDTNGALSKTKEVLERSEEIRERRQSCIGSAVLCIPLLVAMIVMSFTDIMEENMTVTHVIDGIQLLVTTPIVAYYGRIFFVGAWRSWQHRTFTMDTLVAIGTGFSYTYSVVVYLLSLFTGLHMMTYFDTAGMLTSFMLLGRFLEASAKRSTSGALIELMSLVPPVATVVTAEGDVRLPSSAITVGVHVRVLAGDRIPVDGTVVEGISDVDEQMVTGESVPKSVRPGDKVVGGTLNTTATLIVAADKVGEDTMLSQILRIVQEAQNTKPAVQRIADRVAMYFVPFVVGFSVVTLFCWLVLGFNDMYPAEWRHGMPWEAFAFNFFIATVVAACPCALGLATPTAIMVGTGVGAKNGVLVKSGVTLEAVRHTTCVVFDKTGTITNGRLQVVWNQCHGVALGEPTTLARRLVGVVEAQSNHPIAKAVCGALVPDIVGGVAPSAEGDSRALVAPAMLPDVHLEVQRAVTHSGLGMEATVAATSTKEEGQAVREHHVVVGNLGLMEQRRIRVSREVQAMVSQQSANGHTTVVGAVDGEACVVLALSDQPKDEAYGVIHHLHQQGIRTLMVTGDNRHVAGCIARAVGIDPYEVRAEALPTTKATIVQQLQREGHRVMFVGDGINDSPALAQADVGVALGAGTEVAIEAADAVLVRNSLVDLLNLQSLSNTTVRHIYGNFIWAFGYNLAMLPIASGLLYPLLHFQLPPVVAGAAMVMSSLSVLSSSLSIRCFKPHRAADFVYYDSFAH